jgi:ferric-dicitrate binding protein FerR (iron transport regulator)
MSGSTVTTSVGTLAMTLTSGVHLRLDASSAARVDSATDVALERGAVYVDSAGAQPTQPGASPISIHTPAGLVRDIGTQFQVRIEARLGGPGIRIRVRDGQVRVTFANGVDARAGAGEELFSRPDGSDRSGRSISRRPIAVTGSEWAWAERAAPPFSVEGKTLGAFLDWVSREGAWTVTFADRRFSEAARATVLHGRPDLLQGLTPAEALDVVLPICGLRHRIDRHRVVIERETSAGAIQ